jgi:hypothetical protein
MYNEEQSCLGNAFREDTAIDVPVENLPTGYLNAETEWVHHQNLCSSAQLVLYFRDYSPGSRCGSDEKQWGGASWSRTVLRISGNAASGPLIILEYFSGLIESFSSSE